MHFPPWRVFCEREHLRLHSQLDELAMHEKSVVGIFRINQLDIKCAQDLGYKYSYRQVLKAQRLVVSQLRMSAAIDRK